MAIRIAFLIDKITIGGTERQVIEICNRLDRQMFEPILFSLRQNDRELERQIRCEKRVLGIHRLRDLKVLSRIRAFGKTLRDEKIDILQTFFPESTVIGCITGKLSGVPLVISSRRDIATWHSLVNRLNMRIANFFADRILANSNAVKEYVVGNEKVKSTVVDVIYNGIDYSIFASNERITNKKIDYITIGIIGNFLRPVKRLDLFISAMNMLSEKYNNLKIVIVGKVPKNGFSKLNGNLKRMCRFVGSSMNVIPLLQLIDIGVVCSDTEGFCNVILEYMVSSVPCVCSRTTGNIELIRDGIDGLLFEQGNAEELASKVSLLLENHKLRSAMAKQAKEKVEKRFDWSVIIKDYERYYFRTFRKMLNEKN